MKKWKLKRDLPDIKAGNIFTQEDNRYNDFLYLDAKSGLCRCQTFPSDTRSEWLEEVDERWIPHDGEEFYYIDFRCEVIRCYGYKAGDGDYLRIFFNSYNMFQTREQAEECAKLCLETRKKYTESLSQK